MPRRRKQRPMSAVVTRHNRPPGQQQQYVDNGNIMQGFKPANVNYDRRPNTAGGTRQRRTAKSHTVMLDGQPLTGIDPDNFSEFYKERQEQKRIEESRSRMAASKKNNSNRRRPKSAATYNSNSNNSMSDSRSRDDLHYPTANNRRRNNRSGRRGSGRPSSAPGGKRNAKPGSAQANLVARMNMTGQNANDFMARIQMESKKRPISSRDHIRRRAAARRKAAQDFAMQMAEEERLIQQDLISRTQEATKYARVLNLDKKCKHIFDAEGNLQIKIEEDGDISIISTAIFQREHAKLQKHAIAQGLFAAAKGEGSDKEKQKNLRPSQRSRPQVLLELKQILADTENLTGVLESQLKEIESRGWNRGYC